MILLNDFIKAVEEKELNVEGIVILQNGERIAEHRWIPEKARLIHSCSKSFTSAAAGLAISEGLFTLEDSVVELLDLPQYAEEWADLKVKHLLTMSSGHAEGTLLFEERDSIGDWMEGFFRKKRKYPAGKVFVYNNGCTYLISAIIQKCSGEKLVDYLTERLFAPMGWEKPFWAECPAGRTIGLSGLLLTTSQMAEYGQLLLNGGEKDGLQLIPREWIKTATEKHILTYSPNEPDWSSGYGYFFWQCANGFWRADGMLGQFIIVIERQSAVIAINSEERRMQEILNCVWEYILPQL